MILNNFYLVSNHGNSPVRIFIRFKSGLTIQDRRRMLDKDLWQQRPFVIVDPSDPTEILYLLERDFHAYQKVALSNQVNLTIIARATTPADLIGPTERGSDDSESDNTSQSSHLKSSPQQLLSLIGTFFRVGKDLLAEIDSGNTKDLFTKYLIKLYFWSYGNHSVGRYKAALIVSDHLLRILNTQGPMGVVLRLKVSLIALNAFIGGNPLKSTHDLGTYVSLAKGLPSWIPVNIRRSIRSGDLTVIRIWASFLNTYKGIKGTWKKPSASTIMAEPSTADFTPLREFARCFWLYQNWVPQRLLRGVTGFCTDFRIGGLLPYFISAKAGPNGSPAYLGRFVMLDFICWTRHPKGLGLIKQMANLFGLHWILRDLDRIHEWIVTKLPVHPSVFDPYLDHLYTSPDSKLNKQLRKKFWQNGLVKFVWDNYRIAITVSKRGLISGFEHLSEARLDEIHEAVDDYLYGISPYRNLPDRERLLALSQSKQWVHTVPMEPKESMDLYLIAEFPERYSLGALHVIQEAAGKSRVIAINDFFTQQVLKPLHEWLFAICRFFPQDATFDQEGALLKFASREDINEYYSYDLTSATDLIPKQIYQMVLEPIIGSSKVAVWLEVLTNKLFRCPPSINAVDKQGKKLSFVSYSRGQPMGALSSWGLMNLAHHVLVQFAVVYSVCQSLLLLQHKSPYWEMMVKKSDNILCIMLAGGYSFERLYSAYPYVIYEVSLQLFKNKILPFDKYVVLGDDVVIGDRKVAEGYFAIMNNIYGVPIKLAKSYVSDKLFNFANQTYVSGKNISPAPFKELIVGESLTARFEFASRVIRRWYTSCSVVRYMRLVLTTQAYLMWRQDIKVGRVFKPVLPVLYALTLVGAPVIGLPTTDTSTSDKGNLVALGTLAGSPTLFYKKLLGGKECVLKLKEVINNDYPHARELKQYFVYLIKCLTYGYFGNSEESLTLDLKGIPAMIRDLPTKLAILGLIRYNRCETIWIDHSKSMLLERSAVIRTIVTDLRKPHLYTIERLFEILSILVSKPDLFATLDILKARYASTPEVLSPLYDSSLKGTMKSVKDLMHEQKGFTPEERKIRELTLTRIIKCSLRYVELGGTFTSPIESNGTNPEYLGIPKEGGILDTKETIVPASTSRPLE